MGVSSIRLNAEIEAPLEKLAKKMDRSKNYIINQAIKEYVARQAMEEARWRDTEDALQSLQAGNLVTENEVNAWLESWGQDSEHGSEKKPPGK
jgi:predicted transcriptional regulator